MADVLERLGGVPLFANLPQDNLRALAQIVKRTRVPANAIIVRQGDMGRTLFIVDSGVVAALALDERGQATPPRYLHEGDSWGETSLLVGEPRDATMRAQQDVQLLYIQKSEFDELVDSHPTIWDQITPRRDVEIKLKAPDFPWLAPDERVEWFSNKHWIVFARNVVAIAVLWGLAMLAVALFGQALRTSQVVLIALGLLALVTPWAVWSYIDWQNDYHVITNRRVAHLEKILLQYESRSEAPLDKVQNISTQQGFVGNMLDFAQVRINTAGAVTGHVDFDWATDPDLADEILVEQMRRYSLRERSRERMQIQEMLREHVYPAPEKLPEELTEPLPRQGAEPEHDYMSLLRRSDGCTRLVVSTGLFSFLMDPHLPRLGMIVEGKNIIWRKHWILLVAAVGAPLVLFLGLLAVTIMSFWVTVPFLSPLGKLVLGLTATGAAFFWVVWRYEDWRNDLYVVTDQHIIDIERTPFLARESRRQANLENIQDIRYEVPGFWAQLFDLGDVLIETAGQGQFTFLAVRNPSRVQQTIFDRLEVLRQRRREAERREREAEMAQWFAIYHRDQSGGHPSPRVHRPPTP